MTVRRFIKKFCKQTAVYWGNPQNDGYGGMTFDSPREILCRWKDIQSVKVTEDGTEIVQKAEIMVMEDLDIQGWVYKGYLMDIEDYYESDQETMDPRNVPEAHEILHKTVSPFVRSTTDFVYKITLGVDNIFKTKKQYATRY